MDTMITVSGNLVADPVQRLTASGATVVNLRVAASPRRFDRGSGEWRDGDPMFISVSCWRHLAGNVMATLRKGDGVVVYGRLNLRIYDDKQGVRRNQHEIEAVSVGADLNRCAAEIRRPPRPAETVAEAVTEAVTERQAEASVQGDKPVATEVAA